MFMVDSAHESWNTLLFDNGTFWEVKVNIQTAVNESVNNDTNLWVLGGNV